MSVASDGRAGLRGGAGTRSFLSSPTKRALADNDYRMLEE
jgi:hypothetical protein